MASAVSADLESLLNVYELPVGRRLHALRQMQVQVSADASVSELHPVITSTMDVNTVALHCRTQWGEAKNVKTTYPEAAILLNQEHDQIFASVERVSSGMADGMPPGSPLAEAGARLVATVFAEGLAPLTQKDFVQQRETTNVWLSRMDADLAEAVDTLGLRPMVERLGVVNKEMGRIIDEVKGRAKVSYDDVRSTDAAGQRAMLQLIAVICGRFSGREPGDDEKRAALLAPILAQNEKVAELYRRRSRVTDVDPESGEENDPPIEG